MGNRRGGRKLQGVLRGWLAAAAMATLQADERELQPDTLKSWNQCENAAYAAMRQRLHRDGPFLRVDAYPDRLARMRTGEIIVWPACPDGPERIASGLIHDWIGAAFIPNARIVDVVAVARDYCHYKTIYKPGILDARLLSQKAGEDRFSLLLKNPTFFAKTALDGEFQSSYIRLNDTRWYSMTRAVRLQEIDDYGQPTQHKLPPDRGHGYIWRMTSLAQMEERDGGVYVEEEVLALSRDVPSAIRWMAGPIMRRLGRESTALSIQRTRAAVAARPDVISSRLVKSAD
jgi:hypothetical protein